MTTWFVSRHPGAIEWARRHGVAFDRQAHHLDLGMVAAGDRVLGSLPVNMAAELCDRGAEYWHLSLRLLPEDRGRELTADDLDTGGARLERYRVEKL